VIERKTYQNLLRGKAWVVALFVTMMLFTANHNHDVDELSVSHECTICSVASHIDDIDTPEAIVLNGSQYTAIFDPLTEKAAYPIYAVHVAARAPPTL
jgi:hypothetical protein